jgi:3-oxoacyl-[acyl-carrier-protein] synthase II
MPRIVITAMSVVSPIGSGVKEFYDGLDRGITGTDRITCFPTDFFPVSLGAEARREGRIIMCKPGEDRRLAFCDIAFQELFGRRSFERYAPRERLLITGSGLDYFKLERYAESEEAKRHAWHDYSENSCRMFERYAREYSIGGGAIVNVSACVASSQAIGLAYRLLDEGYRGAIIAGGADSMLNPLHYMGFYKLGALSDWTGDPKRASRPFDRDRRGVVLGEGAAFFLLENGDDRETPALAEIAGYASSCDTYLITDPDPDGTYVAAAALDAIEQAGITPDRIDCVHAHGTGTPKNDVAECNAMKRIFGSRYNRVPVFSLKGQVGHLIGACGALEIAAAIYSLEKQVIPATANFETPDPAIDLHVLKQPMKKSINYILKLNAAFGGQNTALVIKKAENHG